VIYEIKYSRVVHVILCRLCNLATNRANSTTIGPLKKIKSDYYGHNRTTMNPSHTAHHDSALLYSDLDLGFDVEETGMVFNAPLNMLSDHVDTHFDLFDAQHIKEEECPLSPTSLNDDMEVTSSPGASNSSASSTGSILDQLTNGNNNVAAQRGLQNAYWGYAQPVAHVVNPMMGHQFVQQPTFNMYHTNVYMNDVVTYNTPHMGYPYAVENPYTMAHLVPMPQHPYMMPQMRNVVQPIQQKQEKQRKTPEESEEELLNMDDEEFQVYVTKFCSCDNEAFEELNSRRHKVIDELKSLEQELQKTRDETLRSYEQLIGNSFDDNTKLEKLNVVREKVDNSSQEVRKHAEAKLRQMVSTAHRKRQNRKLPDRATSILQQWFLENAKYPYPSMEVKAQLQKETNLTLTQINNWFINKRGRALKPIREKIVQQGARTK
jgi:hypothetical protein